MVSDVLSMRDFQNLNSACQPRTLPSGGIMVIPLRHELIIHLIYLWLLSVSLGCSFLCSSSAFIHRPVHSFIHSFINSIQDILLALTINFHAFHCLITLLSSFFDIIHHSTSEFNILSFFHSLCHSFMHSAIRSFIRSFQVLRMAGWPRNPPSSSSFVNDWLSLCVCVLFWSCFVWSSQSHIKTKT